MAYRKPEDIIIDGVPLSRHIYDHGEWRRGKGGKRLALPRADLFRADLSDADISGANLSGCIGNMREIRSMQIDTWPVTYTADTLQIGRQRHPIAKWREWDTETGRVWIGAMNGKALEWAERNLALVLAIIDANPATPTGHEKEAA